MKNKTCCIFNLAPHYNAPIYLLMDRELHCDFYIGDKVPYTIQLMDYTELSGFKKKLKNTSLIGNFYYQKGALSTVFKSYKQYILNGEPYCISNWLILLTNRLIGKKTYLWTHGWYGNESFLKKFFKKAFFGLSTKVLLYGDYARDLMIKEGFCPNKLVPIYNSLNYDEQVQIRQNVSVSKIYNLHFQNNNPVLLYIGRIQNRKKIELLIESLRELHNCGNFCNLMLIGKQTDETGIQDLIASYNLSKFVWFYGPCYDESILCELIYNADVCVSPGNVGLTAMHCMVYGTPVITQNNFASQMPEFESIIPNVTGDFFVEDSVQDLSEKIKKWINIETQKRLEIRENCYKVIQDKYNPNKQIETLKKLLN